MRAHRTSSPCLSMTVRLHVFAISLSGLERKTFAEFLQYANHSEERGFCTHPKLEFLHLQCPDSENTSEKSEGKRSSQGRVVTACLTALSQSFEHWEKLPHPAPLLQQHKGGRMRCEPIR